MTFRKRIAPVAAASFGSINDSQAFFHSFFGINESALLPLAMHDSHVTECKVTAVFIAVAVRFCIKPMGDKIVAACRLHALCSVCK